ncbi:MAG TPA: hypothetical protein VIM77_07285, partial [Mucilaginibacter sp.]
IRLHTSSEPVEQPEEYVDDEPEYKRGVSVWAIVLIVVIVLGLAAFAVYKYKPQWLNLPNKEQAQLPEKQSQPPIAKPDTDTIKKASVAADSVKQTISKPDSALKTSTVVNDTLTRLRYELLGGAFKKRADALATIERYRKLGFTAHILENVPGRLVKLSLGTYFARDEAVDAKQKIIATGKIKEDNITIQPYNPRK